ncbi:MAG: hypothetical protein A3A86_01405 [Elusimicrobia bacterium RIFCSPLOWO2_01_FULL_60_11]|nr:MAG: hypothetical protein A3A86_01405 [Elusimicrobia bacterium RIFCSPLOWO2_01_FULL_60_11]
MSGRHIWLAVLLAGCAAGPGYIIKDFTPPRALAVLPFTNETNDIEAPGWVRKALIEVLPRHGYAPLDSSLVDEVLKERFGITDGGQLGSATPQNLGKALAADGLLYGNVLSFQDLPLGFYRKKTVKINLKILDSKTGELLWEAEKGWTTPEVNLNADEARKAAVRQVADRQKRRLDGTFLKEEAVLALEMALKSLPSVK